VTTEAPFQARLKAALDRTTAELLGARSSAGCWTGELSSSALSTATAVTALAVVEKESNVQRSTSKVEGQSAMVQNGTRISAGLEWLAKNANADGGWGDTILSVSNLSTTALCWAAFGAVTGADEKYRTTVNGAIRWLRKKAGSTEPDQLASAIIQSYGRDRTFSVPILTMCALSGRLGAGREAWRHVIPLPFELAACPHQWFAALRLPVVSYALPALIAIGQARHHHRPSSNPFARLLRIATRQRTLRILNGLQPSNGGFLEATPLTSFVVMSLAGSGEANHPVTLRGEEFLKASQRDDGSWPIDTNLSTWLTTLAVNALPPMAEQATLNWLLAQQYRTEHPYTHAAPGGWAWTDLPGGVPDADDTAGALLALRTLGRGDKKIRAAACSGIEWLLDLQNADGGIPTFCRGWGTLPFDRSSPDLTAHAVHAWLDWLDDLPEPLQSRTRKALHRAIGFLAQSQRSDGSWSPLWFGNQFAQNDENPTYGTSRVLCALATVMDRKESGQGTALMEDAGILEGISRKGVEWLVTTQNSDGGWGGSGGVRSSVEETALAVEALATMGPFTGPQNSPALLRGATWLIESVERGHWTQPAPIGFYFAKLWYYERLYPIIFTVAALKQVSQHVENFQQG
jgi:squalene-hopene/tetraprenyl-beta-curcumene cyclase